MCTPRKSLAGRPHEASLFAQSLASSRPEVLKALGPSMPPATMWPHGDKSEPARGFSSSSGKWESCLESLRKVGLCQLQSSTAEKRDCS